MIILKESYFLAWGEAATAACATATSTVAGAERRCLIFLFFIFAAPSATPPWWPIQPELIESGMWQLTEPTLHRADDIRLNQAFLASIWFPRVSNPGGVIPNKFTEGSQRIFFPPQAHLIVWDLVEFLPNALIGGREFISLNAGLGEREFISLNAGLRDRTPRPMTPLSCLNHEAKGLSVKGLLMS